MFDKLSFFLCAIFILWASITCCDCKLSDENENVGTVGVFNETTNKNKKIDEINVTEIMNYCNESFRIQMDYLQQLNDTGSFPDESDKTPMCFIRCYLEKVGILTDEGSVDSHQAVDMLWTTSGDAIDDCVKEISTNDEKGEEEKPSPCEFAYFLARCVMTRALVDGRSRDTK